MRVQVFPWWLRRRKRWKGKTLLVGSGSTFTHRGVVSHNIALEVHPDGAVFEGDAATFIYAYVEAAFRRRY